MILVAPLLWTLRLRSSLTLDETLTYWVIKDGPVTAIDRALHFQGQSPFYFLIAWVAMIIGGPSEVMLRVPSLAATGLATYLLYRLGMRLLDAPSAALATAFFACSWTVMAFASNARPYALALSMTIAAILTLVRWLDGGGVRAAVLYVLSATLTVYLQPLFATMFAVHVVYIAQRRLGRTTMVRWTHIASAYVMVALLLVPVTYQSFTLWSRRETLTFAPPFSLKEAHYVVLPLSVIVIVLLADVRARVCSPGFLLGAWNLLPPLILAIVSWSTTAGVFVQRYFVCVVPGVFLVLGWAMSLVRRPLLRTVAIAGVVALTALQSHSTVFEDWRYATAAVRSVATQQETPVLIRTGLVEAGQISWFQQPEKLSYLMAPLAFYPIPAHAIPLPFGMSESDEQYMASLIPRVAPHRHFVLLVNELDPMTERRLPLREWFAARVSAYGFTSREVARAGMLSVVLFERP